MQIQYEDDEETQRLNQPTVQEKVQETTSEPKQTQTSNLPEQIIHKVVYGDTLEGLSLEYSVPICRIKNRNHLDGDYIYHLKEIVIPHPKALPITKEKTQDLLIQQFVAHQDYSEKERKVARYYLTEADWNLQNAMKEYKSDLQWEKQNKGNIQKLAISSTNESEMKEIKRFYDRIELYQKKTI